MHGFFVAHGTFTNSTTILQQAQLEPSTNSIEKAKAKLRRVQLVGGRQG